MKVKYFLEIALLLLFSLSAIDAISQQHSAPPSLYPDNWKILENEKFEEALSYLTKALTENEFPIPVIKKSRVRKLLCYENAFIYEFEGVLNDTLRLYTVIVSKDYYRMLKGESSVIYDINTQQRPMINTEPGLKDYVRLFVGALTSDNRRFRVFDTTSEITRFLTPVAEIFSMEVSPSSIVSFSSHDKPSKVSVNLKYQQAFFRAELEVNDTGKIEMNGDRPLFSFPVYLEKFDKGGFLLQYRPASVPDSVFIFSTDPKEYYDKGMKIANTAKSDKDYFTAYKLIEDAAAMGYEKAFGKLGVFFLRGDGVNKDTAMAVALYRKGVEKGDTLSKASLARLEKIAKERKEREELDLKLAKMKRQLAERLELIENMKKLTLEQEKEESEKRNRAKYELVKNKNRFKNILSPGIFTGKLQYSQLTLFSEPLVLEGIYYDAFIIKPLATGYLYWSHNSEMDTKKMAWYILKYVADKSTFEKENSQSYFRGFYPGAGNQVVQNTRIKIEKGQEYIIWFSFINKQDFKEKSFPLTVTATILNDTTKNAAAFYNDLDWRNVSLAPQVNKTQENPNPASPPTRSELLQACIAANGAGYMTENRCKCMVPQIMSSNISDKDRIELSKNWEATENRLYKDNEYFRKYVIGPCRQ